MFVLLSGREQLCCDGYRRPVVGATKYQRMASAVGQVRKGVPARCKLVTLYACPLSFHCPTCLTYLLVPDALLFYVSGKEFWSKWAPATAADQHGNFMVRPVDLSLEKHMSATLTIDCYPDR